MRKNAKQSAPNLGAARGSRSRGAMVPNLVSIIIPCFNAERYLGAAIESVLRQTIDDYELIIVDDGSTDSSREISSNYVDARIIRAETNAHGPSAARNRGLNLSRGEFVAFLDADDYWEPTFLEEMLRALVATEHVLAYCGWQNIGLKGGQPCVPPDYETEDKIWYMLRSASPWPIHAAMSRREALDEAGFFDERLTYCEDYDLWLRLAANKSIVRVPKVLAHYRHHGSTQLTSKQWMSAKHAWQVKREFMRRHPELVAHLSPEARKEGLAGALLRRGYDCYWRRDLISAQKIFRMALYTGSWALRDLKYLLPALLPFSVFHKVIGKVDQAVKQPGSAE